MPALQPMEVVMPKVIQYPIRCDFCNAGEPFWMWDIPPGTPMLTLFDPETGNTSQTQSEGKLAACESCLKLIQSKVIRNKGAVIDRKSVV